MAIDRDWTAPAPPRATSYGSISLCRSASTSTCSRVTARGSCAHRSGASRPWWRRYRVCCRLFLAYSRKNQEYRAASPYLLENIITQSVVDMGQINLMRSPTRLSALGFDRHKSVGDFGDSEIELMCASARVSDPTTERSAPI